MIKGRFDNQRLRLMYEEIVVLENKVSELLKLQGAINDFRKKHDLSKKKPFIGLTLFWKRP